MQLNGNVINSELVFLFLPLVHSRSVKSPLKPPNIDQECDSPVKIRKRSRAIIDSDDEQQLVKEEVSEQSGRPPATPGQKKVLKVLYALLHTVS